MSNREIIEPEPSHKYFHIMLNMADDDLDPFEYRVLGHYIRWAGIGGSTREGIRQGSECCKMSLTKFLDARNSLEAKGYLNLSLPNDNQRANGIATVIKVVDRWSENTLRYAPRPDPYSDQVHGEARSINGSPPVLNMDHSEEQVLEDKEKDSAPLEQTAQKKGGGGLKTFSKTEPERQGIALTKEQKDLCQAISNLYRPPSKLSKELQQALEPFSERYDQDPIYRDYITGLLSTAYYAGAKKIPWKRENVVLAVVADMGWTEYESIHKPSKTNASLGDLTEGLEIFE